MSMGRGCASYNYDPDVSIKKLVVRLFVIGAVSCSLLYVVGLVIV